MNKFAILLLPLDWIGIFALLRLIFLRFSIIHSKRDLVVLSSILWGSLLVLITEILSLFHLITREFTIIAWGSILIILLIALYFSNKKWNNNNHISIKDLIISNSRVQIQSINISQFILLSIIVAQICLLALVAIIYPPTTWDSMTYHMARVAHWQQNQSIAYYATGIIRQIQNQPFSEYTILNLQVIYGSDRFANIVQWFAMLFSLIIVSNITKKLGGNRLQQIISALLVVTLPMGILQATSTQNDYTISLWLVAFFSMCLSIIKNPDAKVWWFGAGFSLGLALFTKATAYIFTIPILFLLWIYLIKNKKMAQSIGICFIIVFLAFIINLGLFIRNFSTFSSPLGPTDGYTNEIITPMVTVSNIIRNTSIQIPFADDSSGYFNQMSMDIHGLLSLLHQFTKLSPIDSRTSYTTDIDPFTMKPLLSEDLAPSPWHLLLILSTIIIGFIYLPLKIGVNKIFRSGERLPLIYLSMIAFCLAFILFSAYLKWQPWQSRLLLPIFVIWCTVIPLILWSDNRIHHSMVYLSIIMGLLSFTITFDNRSRPISIDAPYISQPRLSLYFINQPNLFPVYSTIASQISLKKCDRVGLIFGNDLYEYPLWRVLTNEDNRIIIQYVQVENPSKMYEDPDYKPCALIANTEQKTLPALFSKQVYGDVWLYLEGLPKSTD